jgi:hypothetical protein
MGSTREKKFIKAERSVVQDAPGGHWAEVAMPRQRQFRLTTCLAVDCYELKIMVFREGSSLQWSGGSSHRGIEQ